MGESREGKEDVRSQTSLKSPLVQVPRSPVDSKSQIVCHPLLGGSVSFSIRDSSIVRSVRLGESHPGDPRCPVLDPRRKSLFDGEGL